MTPIARNLIVYRGITFTFYFILRDNSSLIDTFTANASTDVLTSATTHGLSVGDPVQFSNTGGALPNPLNNTRDYFVTSVPTSSTLTVSLSYAGTVLDITSAGSGTNSIYTKRPLDLTGWSVWAWVKLDPSLALVYDLDPQIDGDPTTGKIDLSKTDTQTSTITAGNYLWDVILEKPTGERIGPLFKGTFFVSDLVTEPAI